jgi:hypothetical protein
MKVDELEIDMDGEGQDDKLGPKQQHGKTQQY